MARLNESLFNKAVFNEYRKQGQEQEDASRARRLRRSAWLQHLLNYFDDAYVRVRKGTSTLDSQLLNSVALQLENEERRISRESAASSIREVPLNLDHSGLYYKVRIPDSYEFRVTSDGNLDTPVVRVLLETGKWKRIVEYDDDLPVPAGLAIAGSQGRPCYTLFAADIEGNGLQQETRIGVLDFPNFLYLKVSGLDASDHRVEIVLEGYTEPSVISLSGQAKAYEKLVLEDENIVRTRRPWSRVEKLIVRDLPAGARLQIACAAEAYPRQLDPRAFHHPDLRDTPLQRYWSLSGNLLQEEAFFNRLSGHEYIQSYLCRPSLSAFSIEPNTYGIFGVSGTQILYADRRELFPSNLIKTQIFTEPLYALVAYYDASDPGPFRKAKLEPVRTALSESCYRFRFLVQVPSGETYTLSPDGHLITNNPSAGWRTGAPKAVSVPVADTGDYLFTLETADTEGEVYRDVAAYASLAFEPLFAADTSEILPSLRSVVFDSYQKPWIWTGDVIVPAALIYDNFIFEPDQKAVYLTQSYEQVEIG